MNECQMVVAISNSSSEPHSLVRLVSHFPPRPRHDSPQGGIFTFLAARAASASSSSFCLFFLRASSLFAWMRSSILCLPSWTGSVFGFALAEAPAPSGLASTFSCGIAFLPSFSACSSFFSSLSFSSFFSAWGFSSAACPVFSSGF